jgi:pimeloyl-ACP methyl ester carboxylesterase
VIRSFNSGQIIAERLGTNQPDIVALHGWGRDRNDFSHCFGGLNGWLVDLPGFGSSPRPPSVWRTLDYATALLPLLDDCAAGTVIVGHSFGGRVAVHLGRMRGDGLRGLILMGVPLLRKPAARTKNARLLTAGKWLANRGWLSESHLEIIRTRNGSADYNSAQGVMRGVLVSAVNEDYAAILPQISCRTILLWGTQDTVATLPMALGASRLLPRGELRPIEGAGHMLPIERPDTVRSAVVDIQTVADPA